MKKKLLALSVLTAISSQAGAFQFDTSDDWQIRWDNTFKFNVVSRVNKIENEVIRDSNGYFLADDGDQSVDRRNGGLVSTRFDVFSEFDVIWRDDFGFRISGSAWYDPQYKSDNNDHPTDYNYTWASPSADVGDFNHEAEDLHYAGGELLDAFVFANFDIGDAALGVRAGRHTIYWGNSLLGTGAIAGIGSAMAPLDFSKALSVPGSEAKELFMPTGKISSVLQLTDNLTLNAYYSFEHQRYRLPETGTFFSPAEGLSENTEFISFPPGSPDTTNVALRGGFKGLGDKTETGDFGFNVQYYVDAWNLETSLIYLNYTDMNLHGLHAGFDLGQLGTVQAGSNPLAAALIGAWNAACPGNFDCPNAPVIDADAGTITYGQGGWLFKEDIDLFGISFAKEIAGVSMGMDIVLRKDTGLAPELGAALARIYNLPPSPPFPDGDTLVGALGLAGVIPGEFNSYDSSNYLGATGDVWSVVINGIGLLNGDLGLWDGGSYIVEATFQMLADCNENCQLLDARVKEDRVVSHIAAVFKPTWYQVRPGMNLSLPMNVSYTIDGEKSPLTFGGDEERGTASIGVELSFNEVWTIDTKYNAYFGPVEAGIGGLLKDRDNVSMTFKRAF
tara:strand:- start:57770 stop:59620 length:1851 start_codon:yes stop_codon:yes gene_type:complete